jgi:hypothetical protein
MTQTTTSTTFLPNLRLFGGNQQDRGNFGWHPLHQASFAGWEVALTVVLAAVLVATVVVFVRRLRRV